MREGRIWPSAERLVDQIAALLAATAEQVPDEEEAGMLRRAVALIGLAVRDIAFGVATTQLGNLWPPQSPAHRQLAATASPRSWASKVLRSIVYTSPSTRRPTVSSERLPAWVRVSGRCTSTTAGGGLVSPL